MSVRVSYMVEAPKTGRKAVKLIATYSDQDFAVMFTPEDQAALLAGGTVVAETGHVRLSWLGAVQITAAFDNVGAFRHVLDCLPAPVV